MPFKVHLEQINRELNTDNHAIVHDSVFQLIDSPSFNPCCLLMCWETQCSLHPTS